MEYSHLPSFAEVFALKLIKNLIIGDPEIRVIFRGCKVRESFSQ